jgi:starch synthase
LRSGVLAPSKKEPEQAKEGSTMTTFSSRPRILVVTPEALFIPVSRGKRSYCNTPAQLGFVAYLTQLVTDLCARGADIHVAQPDYRKIFAACLKKKHQPLDGCVPGTRVHLARDRIFFYANPIDSNSEWENRRIAVAFQREVSHQIIPRVQPDLIHCHDWMTGLIPAVASQWGIPCLFTIQNLRSTRSLLSTIEDSGIDGAAIWQHLFYDRYPANYEETRGTNPVDFLLSGILAAHRINFSIPLKWSGIAEGWNVRHQTFLRDMLAQKRKDGYACEILYEKILRRPLVNPPKIKAGKEKKTGLEKAVRGKAIPERKYPGIKSPAFPDRRKPTHAVSA